MLHAKYEALPGRYSRVGGGKAGSESPFFPGKKVGPIPGAGAPCRSLTLPWAFLPRRWCWESG